MQKTLVLALLSPLLPLAIAYADHGGGEPGGHPEPPPEAFEACTSAAPGATCSVTHDGHTMTGTCEAAPETTALACRPEHPPGPPPEAVAACNRAKAGDACTVTHGDQTRTGTCETGPDDGATLACHPARPPA